MMARWIIAGISLLASFAAHAADLPAQSLFFSDAESRQIETQMEKMKPQAENAHGIHLGAVMYYAPDHWTLWLQNEKWTPQTNRPDLHIVSVNPNEVTLQWQRNARTPPQTITLHPYQTYQIGSGKVVEGLK